MVNVAVFNLKDLAKYLLKFTFVILIIAVTSKSYEYMKQNSYTKSLDSTIPLLAYIEESNDLNKKIENKITSISWTEKVLNSQLVMKNNIVKNNNEIQALVENDDEIIENKEPEVILNEKIRRKY